MFDPCIKFIMNKLFSLNFTHLYNLRDETGHRGESSAGICRQLYLLLHVYNIFSNMYILKVPLVFVIGCSARRIFNITSILNAHSENNTCLLSDASYNNCKNRI